MWRGLVLWLIIMVFETMHGVLRGLYLVPSLGEAAAQRIGLAVGSFIVVALAFAGINWTALRNVGALVKLGAIWAGLTLLFEIGIGLLRGFNWMRIWAEIDPARGGTMLLSVAVMFAAPILAAWIRGLFRDA